jgi:hypothetical protein
VQRNLFRKLDAGLSYYRSQPPGGKPNAILTATIRETISPRINLLQLINHSNGQTNISFGGGYVSNRLSVNLDYQTVYVPFLLQPFKQGLAATVSLRVFGNLRVTAQSYIAPDGRVRYTVTGNTVLSRSLRVLAGGDANGYRLPKYIVKGLVLDLDGRPIAGAAVKIDGDVLISDTRGIFELRKKKAGSCKVAVLTEEFVNPSRYEVVSAPSTVSSEAEEKAQPFVITLRPAVVTQQEREQRQRSKRGDELLEAANTALIW